MPPKVAQWIREQEEQKIFKEFEELGYKLTIIAYGYYFQSIKNEDTIIAIDTQEKTFRKYAEKLMYPKIYMNVYTKARMFTIQEHQLLHKLFELWGWFDD